jgi:hypothetical protein
MVKNVHNNIFNKCDKPAVLHKVTQEWIQGEPFHKLFGSLTEEGAKMIWGKRRRKFKIEHVVEICEGALAFEGALLIGALSEFVKPLDQEETSKLIGRLHLFQKQLKYGLPVEAAINLYELGFSDRVIALDLESSFGLTNEKRKDVVKALKSNSDKAMAIVEKYPVYFHERMAELL